MYCRVTWYSGSPAIVDEGIEAVADLLPRIKRFPGYVGFSLLVDRASGDSAGIAYFKDWRSLKASGAAGALVRRQGSDRIGGEIAGVDEYECTLMEVAEPPRTGAWARLISGTGRREKVDTVVKTLRDQVLPVLKQQSGFCASLAGADRKSGKGLTCSIFATRQDLEASGEAVAALRQQLQTFAEMADMRIHTFELVLSEFPAAEPVAS
jgi:hypothetical protein